MIIDGNNAVLGRLASRVAKLALMGNSVDIVNCDKIIISGKQRVVVANYHHKRNERGTPFKGPYYSTRPDMFMKRIIRGMLPHKQTKGREAFERIKFYIGIPKEFEGKTFEKIAQSELRTNSISVAEVCRAIGGRI